MDFQLSDARRELQDTARRFARSELMALSREMEEKAMPPSGAMRRRYAEMGFLGINPPAQYGGRGLGHLEALLVLEQFAMVSPAVAWPILESATGPVRTVEHSAGESVKARILPEVLKGEKIC